MKNIYALIFFLSAGICHGQNLVPNPSFEEYIGCPQFYPDLDNKCFEWLSFRGTPDYFHNCSDVCGYDNAWGYQEPRSGEAYIALWTYQPTTPQGCEHVAAQLISPLTVGERYYVSFFVSSGYTPLLVNIATNKLGVLFSTYTYYDYDAIYPLPNMAHIYTDSIIADTLDWVKVSGSFIADSAYQYIIIGRFFEDTYIDSLHLPYSIVPQASCYYLDDVCVSTDSLLCDVATNLKKDKDLINYISIFPNPSHDLVTISSHNELERIIIYNSSGQLLFTEQDIQDKKKVIDISSFPKGLYAVCIGVGKNKQTFKFIIN